MTNLQEAKLAREAEICYTTIALVTDYDCWHPDHDSVTVDMIVANLMQNAKTAQQVIAATVERLPIARDCECARALATAIITRPEAIPAATKKTLQPIVGKYLLSERNANCRHRFDRVRLPDVVSGQVHGTLPARALLAVSLSFSSTRWTSGAAAARRTSRTPWRCSASGRCSWRPPARISAIPTLARGGRRGHVPRARSRDKFTASFFCSTDTANNQIASFYTGAMAHAAELSFRTAGRSIS
jgi:hypothetical protein